MTNATTRSRTRKAKATATALMPRGQHLIDQGADMLILSARMAETPVPVFWAKGELDARTTLAVHAGNDWDGHYEHADVGGGYHWDWYRAAILADDLAGVPVVTVTRDLPPGAPLPLGDLSDENEARFKAVFSDPDEEGARWRPVDDPGPAAPVTHPPAHREKGPAGPGSPDDDPALDEADES